MSKKVTTESFIKKAKEIHGDKYDYSNVVYKKAREKVIIICPKHGEFVQTPNSHLNGNGCPHCKSESTGDRCRDTVDNFIRKSKLVHGNTYDYSNSIYRRNNEKIEIICPVHGSFWQYPQNHLRGCGCPACKGSRISTSKTRTRDEFIQKAKDVHGNTYDYSKVNYINSVTPVEIICNVHKMSFWQSPANHLRGQGCPKCNSSKLEILVRENLSDNKIKFEEQKTWDWLIYKSHQYVDFYIPEYNIAIECQGAQHFEEVEFFGGEENLKETINRDNNKIKLCMEHNIKLIYVSNLGNDYPYPYEVITDINNLINEIKKTSLTN